MTFVEFFVWIAVILWAFDVDDATLAGLAALVQPVPAAFLAPAIASVGDRLQGGTALVLAYALIAVTCAAPWSRCGSTPRSRWPSRSRPPRRLRSPSCGRSTSGRSPSSPSRRTNGCRATRCRRWPTGRSASSAPSPPGWSRPHSATGGLLDRHDAGRVRGRAVQPPPALVPGHRRGPAGRRSSRRARGHRTLWGDWGSLALLLVLTVGYVITGALDVLGVSYAAEVLGIQVTGAGVLIGSVGTGGLVGALPGASLARGHRLASVIVLGDAVEGLALAGTAGTVMLVSGRTLLERSTDDRVPARVFAIQESATPLGTALGAVPGPLAIAWFSPRGGFVPIGLACALLAVTGWCSSVGTTPVRAPPVGDRAAARRSLPVRAS